MTTKPSTPSLSETRLNSLQQMATKLILLGHATMQAYTNGELEHPLLLPLCAEIINLEQQEAPLNTQAESTVLPPVVDLVNSDPAAMSEPPLLEIKTTYPDPPFATSLPTVVAQFTPVAVETGVTCQQCGATLASGRKFCTRCGAPVVPTGAMVPSQPHHVVTVPPSLPKCPSCNEMVPADILFCTNCGYQLQSLESVEPVLRPLTPTLPVVPPPQQVPPAIATGPITQYCNNCGLGLPSAANACPECGSRDIGA